MVWVFLTACGQAGADEVASVMVADGAAYVVRDGVETPARTGLMLDRDDTVRTDADGAIVLQLVNDHVVRIDSDLELVVSDLVMLSAPKSSVTPGVQLAGLLYPAERERMGAIVSDAERVAGWHARLTAAYAPSGVADEEDGGPGGASPDLEAKQAKEETRRDAAVRGGENLAVAPPDAEPDPVVRQPEPASVDPVASTEAQPSPPPPPPPPPGSGRPRPDKKKDRGLAPADEAPPQAPPDPLDELAARFALHGDLHVCLTTWAATLPVRPAALDVRLVVRGGQVERAVVTNGGLRLPACALEALEGEDHGIPETRVMRLPL